ncbi:CapA family protein [Phyllobacterium lublinensis]|uniref:CapA family protein n=1 Tax=Phyllobacterium lublinensis TaxID=2875708 RepID=UPI001CCAB666|nr:CapA family protein [Phyllobacterium sp. 2063]MBZ9653734.1 CapA family protein [Phyllobacterium sp. 2063]
MVYSSEGRDIRFVAVGDAMPTRSLTRFEEPEYLQLVELLRSADASIANLETTVRTENEGNPNVSTGTIMSTPPELVGDLQWMGINLVSASNNHACDYGVGGILATKKYLGEARLPFAGIGPTLMTARAPGYLDTRNGRVAIVSATSFFGAHARAGDSRPDTPGRPGINPLRFTKVHTVDEKSFGEISRMKEALGYAKAQKRNASHFYSSTEAPLDRAEEIVFLDNKFRLGSDFSVTTAVHPEDAADNLRQISDARRRADWVVFAFHNHELGPAGQEEAKSKADMEEPATFALEFCHAAIDAGADMVVCHGPHVPFGVEIYKGKPILHSLGNFILQNDTVTAYPADAYARFGMAVDATPADFIEERSGNGTKGFDGSRRYWSSIAAECEFKAGRLSKLILHPLDLGYGTRRSERGRPVIATGEVAQFVLERVKHLSERFGTTVVIEGERATVAIE